MAQTAGRLAILILLLPLLSGCSNPSREIEPPKQEETLDETDDTIGNRSAPEIDGLSNSIRQPISWLVEHGSILVTHFDFQLLSARIDGQLASLTIVNSNQTRIGFLEPSRTYRLEIEAIGQLGTARLDEVVTLPTNSWTYSEQPVVLPGAQILEVGCTMGFILRNAANDTLYALSAGHCEFVPGKEYAVSDSSLLESAGNGTISVRAITDHSITGFPDEDWALLEILPDARNLTNPAVRYWGGPTGVHETEMGETDHTLCWYGWGQAYNSIPELRPRCGTWEFARENRTYFQPGGDVGDSGAPVIDASTGAAIGILEAGNLISGRAFNLCSILTSLAGIGYDLRLLTAPLTGQSPRTPIPPEVPFPLASASGRNAC